MEHLLDPQALDGACFEMASKEQGCIIVKDEVLKQRTR